MRISNSFSEGEIQVLEFILQTLLRGGTPHLATRNKDFASIYRKVMLMKKKVAEKKEEDRLREQSSVGTIGAANDIGSDVEIDAEGDDVHQAAG